MDSLRSRRFCTTACVLWIPAFAGMTVLFCGAFGLCFTGVSSALWVPAFAGMTLVSADAVLDCVVFARFEAYSATSKSSTTLSVRGKLWQLSTKPRATS
jgi:hypothetical protein